MAEQKNVSEMVYISYAEIAKENNRTKSSGESLFFCRHIYLCKQLLQRINRCCQIMMWNSEMTSPWSSWSLLHASRKMTTW